MRLIDADALNETLKNIEIKFLRRLYDVSCLKDKRTDAEKERDIEKMFVMLVASQIVDAPTVDAVKVIRCRDCKYYEETKPFSIVMTVCRYGDHTEWTEPNGYCHRAKRVKNAND